MHEIDLGRPTLQKTLWRKTLLPMDKFTLHLNPNSSIENQIISIQPGTTIFAANIRSQTRTFLKRRAKTKPLQHRETSSSPRTFQPRNAAYERITNLQHRETSQTPDNDMILINVCERYWVISSGFGSRGITWLWYIDFVFHILMSLHYIVWASAQII